MNKWSLLEVSRGLMAVVLVYVFLTSSDVLADDKGTIVMVSQENCVYCDLLENEVRDNLILYASYISKYHYSKIDVDSENNTFEVEFTPTVLLISEEGEELGRISGYQNTDVNTYFDQFKQLMKEGE